MSFTREKDGAYYHNSIYISYHEFEHATKKGSDVCQRLVKDLGPVNKVILLRNHGPITVGKTVYEAFFLMYQLVEACRVQVNVFTNQESSYYKVDQKIVEETYKIVQNNYTGDMCMNQMCPL